MSPPEVCWFCMRSLSLATMAYRPYLQNGLIHLYLEWCWCAPFRMLLNYLYVDKFLNCFFPQSFILLLASEQYDTAVDRVHGHGVWHQKYADTVHSFFWLPKDLSPPMHGCSEKKIFTLSSHPSNWVLATGSNRYGKPQAWSVAGTLAVIGRGKSGLDVWICFSGLFSTAVCWKEGWLSIVK